MRHATEDIRTADNVGWNSSTTVEDDIETHKAYIDADEFHVRSYVDVQIEQLADQRALVDEWF